MLIASLQTSASTDQRVIHLEGIQQKLWFRIQPANGQTLPKIKNLDFVAIALLPLAMHMRRDVHIKGPVTRRMLDNLSVFQNIWTSWQPERYTPIRISCDFEITSYPPHTGNQAVAMASGGVDSTFMLQRHTMQQEGRLNRDIAQAVLVHGFDMPLRETDGFRQLHAATNSICRHLRLPLTTVQTNWKEQFCPDWEMMHCAGLAAILHQFSDQTPFGLAALDQTYNDEVKPWGSHSLLWAHLSGGHLHIEGQGGYHSRTEKVHAISTMPELVKNLRVCWQGARTGRNCGVCEKCIRTKLNLYATPHNTVWPFDSPLTTDQVAKVKIKNLLSFNYLTHIIKFLRAMQTPESQMYIGILEQKIQDFLQKQPPTPF